MIRFLDSRTESLLLSLLALFTLRIPTAHIFHMILTTLTLLILCHALQRKSEKCTKNRGARAEPSLMNPLFLDVFW